MVHQAVRIARADERIAISRAGVLNAKNAFGIEIEETYFKLLIAERQLTLAESRLRSTENRPLYAAVSSELVRAPAQEPESLEAGKAIMTAATEVRELTAFAEPRNGLAERYRARVSSASSSGRKHSA